MEEPVAANAGVALNATETQRRTKAIKYFNNKLLGYTFKTFWPHLHGHGGDGDGDGDGW